MSKEITKYVKTASKDASLIKHLESLEEEIKQQITFRDHFQTNLDEKNERLGPIE